jgi:hypothetical protein
MNERQLDAINEIIDFLLSKEFQNPRNVDWLVNDCNNKIRMLEYRRVDDKIINHFTEICEQECNKYI